MLLLLLKERKKCVNALFAGDQTHDWVSWKYRTLASLQVVHIIIFDMLNKMNSVNIEYDVCGLCAFECLLLSIGRGDFTDDKYTHDKREIIIVWRLESTATYEIWPLLKLLKFLLYLIYISTWFEIEVNVNCLMCPPSGLV